MIKADIVDRVVDLAQVPRAKAATAVETVIEAASHGHSRMTCAAMISPSAT